MGRDCTATAPHLPQSRPGSRLLTPADTHTNTNSPPTEQSLIAMWLLLSLLGITVATAAAAVRASGLPMADYIRVTPFSSH